MAAVRNATTTCDERRGHLFTVNFTDDIWRKAASVIVSSGWSKPNRPGGQSHAQLSASRFDLKREVLVTDTCEWHHDSGFLAVITPLLTKKNVSFKWWKERWSQTYIVSYQPANDFFNLKFKWLSVLKNVPSSFFCYLYLCAKGSLQIWFKAINQYLYYLYYLV